MNASSEARRRWRVEPGVWLIALWMLMVIKEVETLLPLVYNPWVKMGTTLAFVLLLLALLFGPLAKEQRPLWPGVNWLLPLLAGGANVWLVRLLARTFGRFGYALGGADLLAVGLPFAALALAGLFWTRWPRRWWHLRPTTFLLLAWAAATLAWLVPLLRFPLHGDRSDMLPVIVAAGQSWLAGQNPYQWFTVGTHPLPMVYLPSMWLPYVPLVALRLDVRLLTPLAQLAFLLVSYLGVRRRLSTGWWAYLLWIALNPYLFIRHDVHVYLLWAVVGAALLCLLRGRWLLAALCWGLLLAFRQTLWVLFPFYLIWLLWKRGWRLALRDGALAVGVALLLIGPFLLADPAGFRFAIYDYQHNLVTAVLAQGNWERIARWASGFSLVPLLHLLGWTRALTVAQVVVWLGLFAAALWRRPGVAETLRWMSLALLAFLLLNPLIMTYMHAELLVLVAFAALARQEVTGLRTGRGTRRLNPPTPLVRGALRTLAVPRNTLGGQTDA